MSNPWQLRVYDKQQLVYSANLVGPAEIGRQSEGECGPYFQKQQPDGYRVVIARLDEPSVSRKHALIEPVADQRVRVTNLSGKLPIRLPDGAELRPAVSCELTIPATLTLGNKAVRVQKLDEGQGAIESLEEPTITPGHHPAGPSPFPLLALAAGPGGMQMEIVIRWLQVAMDVLQSATSSSEFFAQAARAVVELVGLSSGRVLLLDKDQWRPAAIHSATLGSSEGSWQPSRQVLSLMCQEKKAYWQVPTALPQASLVGVKAVVAAPILDHRGEVIGALYGERRQEGGASSRPITKLDAMLVALLAGGVAAGLARMEQEQAALRARVQFEQFFTPELSRLLEAQPDLLVGRDAEVTVLFCDIRRFSRVTEQLGPTRALEWVRDVLSVLSKCIRNHQGVLVDYIGDEVMAMWGAPAEQPDHARRACLAALDILAALPELSQRWGPVLKQPLELGIGINSGPARVGNVGSDVKFKYGPLGTTVNVGSRVEGATKFLKTNLLVTGPVHARYGSGLHARRLCRVRMVNIVEPVDLYEVVGEGPPGWDQLQKRYEEALGLFEKKELRQAARVLGQLLADYPDDGPTLVLNSRVAISLVEEGKPFDPVWELPGK